MSWRWSRLAILAFLVLLYASPLSSGDKGLWLSVASMPVPLFGALPGATPPEHSILLPDRAELARSKACSYRGDPALGAWFAAVDPTPVDLAATTTHPSVEGTLDTICPAPAASRGPPA
jgi:hypothetical protein